MKLFQGLFMMIRQHSGVKICAGPSSFLRLLLKFLPPRQARCGLVAATPSRICQSGQRKRGAQALDLYLNSPTLDLSAAYARSRRFGHRELCLSL